MRCCFFVRSIHVRMVIQAALRSSETMVSSETEWTYVVELVWMMVIRWCISCMILRLSGRKKIRERK